MEGDALLPTTFIMKVTILIKAINKNKPFCLTCGSPLILYVQDLMPHKRSVARRAVRQRMDSFSTTD